MRFTPPHQVPEKYKEPYASLQEPRRTYAGMVAAMDEAVGQIVAAIDETGRRKNTLFIFSSDNGGPAPGKVTDNGPLRAGKATLYEGGVRVCAFIAWEGHIKPGIVDEPLHMVDWYPTLLKLTRRFNHAEAATRWTRRLAHDYQWQTVAAPGNIVQLHAEYGPPFASVIGNSSSTAKPWTLRTKLRLAKAHPPNRRESIAPIKERRTFQSA